MYGKLEKLTERLLAKLHPSNLVNTILYLVFSRCDSEIVKNLILEEVISYRFPIQTLYFFTALPIRQDGVKNRDRAYYQYHRLYWFLILSYSSLKFVHFILSSSLNVFRKVSFL